MRPLWGHKSFHSTKECVSSQTRRRAHVTEARRTVSQEKCEVDIRPGEVSEGSRRRCLQRRLEE